MVKDCVAEGRWVVHRECTGNAERAGAGKAVDRAWLLGNSSGGQGSGFAGNKPIQQASIKFFGGGAGGAAVLGARNFPELSIRIPRSDLAGVADGNVAIELSVDE
jgi:hypothetical protein